MKRCPKCGGNVPTACNQCTYCGIVISTYIPKVRKTQPPPIQNNLKENCVDVNCQSISNTPPLIMPPRIERYTAAIKCPRCGEYVDTTYNCCFHCGYAPSHKKRNNRIIKLFGIIIIVFLIIYGFFLYQNNKNVCPFSILAEAKNQNDVIAVLGSPDKSYKWTYPSTKIVSGYSDSYFYTFMNNTGDLDVYYNVDKSISGAYYELDYPLNNPSVLDNSIRFADETVNKLASHFIKFYTKKYGGYKLNRDSYVWELDINKTISLEFDPDARSRPIKLKLSISE